MAKRRRSECSGLEDVDRTLYTSFCQAANSISQLYTQAQQLQKVSFQSGQRVGLEKLLDWIHRQHQVGLNPTTFDIMNHLKNELDGLAQAEMTLVQAQPQPASMSQIQHFPLPPYGRAGMPFDQARLPFPTGTSHVFPSDASGTSGLL